MNGDHEAACRIEDPLGAVELPVENKPYAPGPLAFEFVRRHSAAQDWRGGPSAHSPSAYPWSVEQPKTAPRTPMIKQPAWNRCPMSRAAAIPRQLRRGARLVCRPAGVTCLADGVGWPKP
jgi:hypothetical protein